MKINWMMNNSKGKPDALLTFAFLSFIVVSFCIVLSCLKSVAFRAFSVELTMPDTSLLLGYLAATFGSYVTKRYHDVKTGEKKE
jgi:hypothetical protein